MVVGLVHKKNVNIKKRPHKQLFVNETLTKKKKKKVVSQCQNKNKK